MSNAFETTLLINLGTSEYLVNYCDRHGMTPQEMSEAIGRRADTVRDVIRDRTQVQPTVAVLLGRHCNVPWHMLMSCHAFTSRAIGLEDKEDTQ